MSHDPKSNYYDAGNIEVLAVIKAKLTTKQLEGYYLGNAIKYSLRLNHKGTAKRDAEKLEFYSHFLNGLLNAPATQPKMFDIESDMKKSRIKND